jgi:hypothetical protein
MFIYKHGLVISLSYSRQVIIFLPALPHSPAEDAFSLAEEVRVQLPRLWLTCIVYRRFERRFLSPIMLEFSTVIRSHGMSGAYMRCSVYCI